MDSMWKVKLIQLNSSLTKASALVTQASAANFANPSNTSSMWVVVWVTTWAIFLFMSVKPPLKLSCGSKDSKVLYLGRILELAVDPSLSVPNSAGKDNIKLLLMKKWFTSALSK
jgi:hypothetical protein